MPGTCQNVVSTRDSTPRQLVVQEQVAELKLSASVPAYVLLHAEQFLRRGAISFQRSSSDMWAFEAGRQNRRRFGKPNQNHAIARQEPFVREGCDAPRGQLHCLTARWASSSRTTLGGSK